MATLLRRHSTINVLLLLGAYLLPFLLVTKAHAAALICTSTSYQCISEGAPLSTLIDVGQWSSAEDKRGIRGAVSIASTTLTDPSNNGFGHFARLKEPTPPFGYGMTEEYLEAGITNGWLSAVYGYSQNSSYNWYSQSLSWCSGYSAVGAGG